MNKIVYIALTTFVILSCSGPDSRENLIEEVEFLQSKNDSLAEALVQVKSASNYWYQKEFDGRHLIALGINDPEMFIKDNLRKQQQLIPIKATLGGSMHFGNIQLLGSEWLIADFDDDHVQGKGIYRYTLNDSSKLQFELLYFIGPE